jgi:putative ABC transport system permease protein
VLFRIAFREFKNRKRFSLIFLFNIAFGLIGLMLMQHFRVSFDQVLEGRAKSILGADISIEGRGSVSSSKISLIKKSLGEKTQLKKNIGMFTMASHKDLTRLVWFSAMEEGYPFYGGLELQRGGHYPGSAKLGPSEVWIYPELKVQLGASIGDKLKIGASEYTISDIIEKDHGQTFQMGAMAPKVIVGLNDLARADLIKKGSSVWYGYYFKFADQPSNIKEVKKNLVELLDDNSKRVLTPQNASENVGRVVNYLNDFLGLVSLVALFLATVGAFYLYRSYLSEQRRSIATLHALGFRRKHIFKIYGIHLSLLGFCGSLLAILIVSVFTPIVLSVLGDFIPIKLSLVVDYKAMVLGFLVGLGGCLFIGMPLIFQRVRASEGNPFHNIGTESQSLGLRDFLLFIPWGIYYCSLAVYVSNSIQIGLVFSAIFLGTSALIFPSFTWLIKRLAKINFGFTLRFIFRDFRRFKTSSVTIFLSLVLGSLLLTLIPNLESSLLQEVERPEGTKLPSLFLFDIQEEQVTPLQSMLKAEKSPLKAITPMIRARLLEINDKKIEVSLETAGTREEQRERRFRNRGVNLTFRETLGIGEEVIEGKYFSKSFDGEGFPEISIEKRYATRLGATIGDKLSFDVLGMEIEGKITSIRSVRWTTFMPNFFIVFQPGVLDDAPKTYLGVIGAQGAEEKDKLMLSLYNAFPNVSSVDVTRLIKRILILLAQMKAALQGMSLLSVLVGFFVVSALVGHQANARKRDWALLKTLGLPFKELRRLQLYSILLLTGGGSLLGIILSYFVGYGLSYLFFDGLWRAPVSTPLLTWFGLTLFGVIVGELAVRNVMKVKPAILLQEAR